MKYLETSYLDTKEKRALEKKGLFCYDLRHSDFGGEIACIEKTVLVNRVGSMVTNEEIPLGDKYPDDKDYEEFIKENEKVTTIEELLTAVEEEKGIEQIKKKMEKILTYPIYEDDYKEYQIGYIMIDKENKEKNYGIAFDENDTCAVISMEKEEVEDIPEWSFIICEDVFEALEDKMQIGYMNVISHVGIWQQIGDYLEDIQHKNGMQKYLQYCKKKNITKESILKEFKTSRLPDAMKYYKEEKQRNDKNRNVR